MSTEIIAKLSKKREINWFYMLLHLQCINATFLYALMYFWHFHWATVAWSIVLVLFGILGVTAGSHRLWAHKSYTASPALKIFLALCQTLVGHGSIYDWVAWHRLHHKHFGTDLDPYNPSRGLFFSHLGSVVFSLSPAQQKALEDIDMSDLEEDKIVMFQKKFYYPLMLLITFLFPMNTPVAYWNETMFNTMACIWWFRLGLVTHATNAIHSASTIWGLKPGEKFPCDSNLIFILTKTNWLSYHYLAPWDYRTGEYGKYASDVTTTFIRICEVLELASDLRTLEGKHVREALLKSAVEKRPIAECLLDVEVKADPNRGPIYKSF